MVSKPKLLPQNTISKTSHFLKKSPAYIFHHIVKCGGSSIGKILKDWFFVIYDHISGPEDLKNYINKKYDMNNINSEYCIIGHFDYDGIYIHQRYPEIFDRKEEIKVFTFVRDPLDFFVSFYYYSRSHNRMHVSLESFINSNKNLIAYFLDCDESNYRKILDRYFFIGVLEHMQLSMDKLASTIHKPKTRIPFLNHSIKDSQISILTPSFIQKFKLENNLDYLIYEYCQEKLNIT